MKNFSILAFLLLFNLNAKIISTDKISDLEEEFSKADINTIIIFDIDQTLTEPVDRARQGDVKEIVKKQIQQPLEVMYQKLSPDQKYQIYCERLKMKQQLVHQKLPNLIDILQSRGIKTLAITLNHSDKTLMDENTEDIIEQRLKSLGINFQKSWKDVDPLEFSLKNNFFEKYERERTPEFKNGIIYTCHLPKGMFISEFLRKIPQKFSKIIFVDNQKKHIVDVENAIQNLKVEYIGIHFTYNISKTRPYPLDFQKAKIQFENLVKKQHWISDEEFEKIKIQSPKTQVNILNVKN